MVEEVSGTVFEGVILLLVSRASPSASVLSSGDAQPPRGACCQWKTAQNASQIEDRYRASVLGMYLSHTLQTPLRKNRAVHRSGCPTFYRIEGHDVALGSSTQDWIGIMDSGNERRFTGGLQTFIGSGSSNPRHFGSGMRAERRANDAKFPMKTRPSVPQENCKPPRCVNPTLPLDFYDIYACGAFDISQDSFGISRLQPRTHRQLDLGQ
ncbi:uncharacterized protein EI90DRAFT_1190268 [Cantharellus anzutake]|uniref:uncharacterized protein n=1 Tax=Cantharellus anzutake TaxID=1750568 RepID=UPI0019032B25|nr:uncharacterized protein EI90DRAFT_1190268 [Cantharellus anzutake]KAF8330426.1 hypothetical protein EI90DRAFT_1190268 [Cantharellus anzutake]